MIINNLLIIGALASLTIIVLGNNWRYKIAGLAILYVISFTLILQIWPIALASVKLIAGWMGIALLSASQINNDEPQRGINIRSAAIFRLMIVVLVWIVLMAVAPAVNLWIPIPYTNLYIGLSVVAAGLIYSSISRSQFDVFIGVLCFLAGFDIIYSSVEGSALVTGIYALIVIFICLLNTYFSSSVVEEQK